MSAVEPLVPARPPIEDRPDFETLITRVSARLLAAAPEDVTSVVVEVLDAVRVFLGADRCGLLSVSDEGRVLRLVHASYGKGIHHVPPEVDLASAFEWSRRLVVDQGLPVCIGRLDDLPPEAAVDRAAYVAGTVRSSLTVPILIGQRVEHLVSVQTLRDEVAWPPADVARVRLLGKMVVNALGRARVSGGRRERAGGLEAGPDWRFRVLTTFLPRTSYTSPLAPANRRRVPVQVLRYC